MSVIRSKRIEEKTELKHKAVEKLALLEQEFLMQFFTDRDAVEQFFRGMQRFIDTIISADAAERVELKRLINNTGELIREVMNRGEDEITQSFRADYAPEIMPSTKAEFERVIKSMHTHFALLLRSLEQIGSHRRTDLSELSEPVTEQDEVIGNKDNDEKEGEQANEIRKEVEQDGNDENDSRRENASHTTDGKTDRVKGETREFEIASARKHILEILGSMREKRKMLSDPGDISMTAFLRNLPIVGQTVGKRTNKQKTLKILTRLQCIRVYRKQLDAAQSTFIKPGSAPIEIEKVAIDFARIDELFNDETKQSDIESTIEKSLYP